MKYFLIVLSVAFSGMFYDGSAMANGASGTFGSCEEKERIGRSAYEQEYGTLRCNVVGQAEIDELHDFAARDFGGFGQNSVSGGFEGDSVGASGGCHECAEAFKVNDDHRNIDRGIK